jgi:energy-coupling factor transporter ATP-binding protein EcfA2
VSRADRFRDDLSPGDLVRALELEAGFGARTALRLDALRIATGRTTVVLGPGGSGKSTLLGLLAGRRDWPDDFWWRGELSVAALTRGWMAQRRLDRPLSALLPGVARASLGAVWPQAPELVELLAAHADRPGSALPRGLERLAAITSVLAARPRVLLLDEPEVELSRSQEESLTERLRAYPGTVVCTTHNLRFARAIADDALLLVHGELIESGPAPSFFGRPRHPRTADYLRLGG